MAKKITHNMKVFSSELTGECDLTIALYGGESNACGSVRFTFTDDADRYARHLLVQEWEKDGTLVALITEDPPGQIVLMDERKLAEREA